MEIGRRNIIAGVMGLALAGTATAGLWGWHTEHKKAIDLEKQLLQLQKQEMRSAVVRSVSSQMEEIAYQQKEISDEQREEALQQTKVANEERHRSEIARQNAQEAERNALASEKRALEASAIAENQRQIAEHQRIQAEFSKRVADTLSYIALGRSLGSLSITQQQAGNQDIANLLAYSSYLYTQRYHGDIYNPAVYQAMTQASQSLQTWAKHLGSISDVDFAPGSNDLLYSVSTYGEIMQHRLVNGQLQSSMLFSNHDYDFRDMHIDDNGMLIALSRSGHLVVISPKGQNTIPLVNILHPKSLMPTQGSDIMIVGENKLAHYNTATQAITGIQQLDFTVNAVSRKDNLPILFDNQGRAHTVKANGDLQTTKVPVKGTVTAYASSKATKTEAYGMSDGSIYLITEKGAIRLLVGHRSRITKLKMDGSRLFSSSYDGQLLLWMTNQEKTEPMTLFNTDSWMLTFNFDNSKNYVWTGDQHGNLTQALISVPMMVNRLQRNLSREFTNEEWDYYIGKNVPYEKLMTNK